MASSSGVLVLGAGELGNSVLSALASHPGRAQAPISVLLRQGTLDSQDPAKRSSTSYFQSLGISLVAGDIVLDTIESLASTFKSYHTIIVCTGFNVPPGTQRKIAQAVLAAHVPRYLPWQFGVDYDTIGLGSDQDLFDEQLSVRELLRAQSETEWVILSTGMFISFLFEPAFGVVDVSEKTARALGDWDTEVTVTAVEDIGRMTAEVVLGTGKAANGVVFIAGDTISYARLADLVEAKLGQAFTRERWSRQFLEDDLKKNPDDKMNKYRGVFAAGVGVSWPLEKTLNHQLGIELSNVEAYLQRTQL